MERFLFCSVLVGLLLIGTGCTETYDPDLFPTRRVPVERTDTYRVADLDGDGRDEFFKRGHGPDRGKRSVFLSTRGRSPDVGAGQDVVLVSRASATEYDLHHQSRVEVAPRADSTRWKSPCRKSSGSGKPSFRGQCSFERTTRSRCVRRTRSKMLCRRIGTSASRCMMY